MKPSAHHKRLGNLTLEQYLGLSEGMSYKLAGRMITLAGDYTNDVIRLHEEGMDPRHDRESLTHLARAATRAETNLAQLLVLAVQECAEWQLMDVPEAIRCNMKTVARCRSALCRMAMSAHQQVRDERMAA
ncbi:MAG TPA: hypothetical protein VNA28_09425 [Solirubrobacteraceae bacterium]|nr:hypothetical protein [Solirubrobacteraceae bacterium]